jgi:UDP-N-acetylglucosamine 2-epimerase (non-hydrolysing)
MFSGIDNIMLLPSLHYRDLVRLMIMSSFILTDSGGIQEEAPSLGKPVLVLRDKTERPEALEAGSAAVVGTDDKTIMEKATELLNEGDTYKKMAVQRDVYGDGNAAKIIAKKVKDLLKE